MTDAVLFGAISAREVAEFLKGTMEHDGTVRVRPTPSDAESVVYQRSLADPEHALTVETFREGAPSRIYDGARTEVFIEDGRGGRELVKRLAEEFGGLLRVQDDWTVVAGNRADRLSPKARLCIAVFSAFDQVSGFPRAVRDTGRLHALRDALDAYLGEHG